MRDAPQPPCQLAQLGELHGTSREQEAPALITVPGDRAGCQHALERLVAGGADLVVLQPIRGREEQQIAHAKAHLIRRV